tara:strand:- start:3050 stop:3259 length:210 start_codon:yes stop_codon:yes gene_type:complete
MRDPERIKIILDKFKGIWELYPDLRMCQIISIITDDVRDIFYIEDDEFEKRLDDFYEKMLKEKSLTDSL